jgi:DNA-binding transcriptional LysR family regulator
MGRVSSSHQLTIVSERFTIVNLSAIDLNLLLVLDAVIGERSVGRAAKRLHVTPPAISNALTRLRAVLGDPIVTRSGRGIVPTPRALQLAPAIARALAEISTAIDGDVFDPATTRTQFTLGVADAGQIARLPKLTVALGAAMPHARLRVVHVDTMIALGGLAGTEVDVAIGISEPAAGIHKREIYAEHSVVIARRDHPRLGARTTARALAAEQHVQVHVAFGKPSKLVEKSYARLGVARQIAVIVPTFAAAVAIVAATDLIATIPESVVTTLGLGVRIVASPLLTPPMPMFMSWHRRTDADPAMARFRALIASVAR